MLKRFYKYHFVDQNSGGRDRTRISFTHGPDRVVLETYTKFTHDTVIDRYFPGIEPNRQNSRNRYRHYREVPRRQGVPRTSLLGSGLGPQTDRRPQCWQPTYCRSGSRAQSLRRNQPLQHLHARCLGHQRRQTDLSQPNNATLQTLR